MAVSTNIINTELQSLTRRLDFDRLPVAQADAQFSQLSSQMSQLGTQVGQVSGGFMSLTQELDIPPELLNEALTGLDQAAGVFTDGAAFDLNEELGNVRGVVNRGIVMLAANPPGLQIQNQAGALNSQLETLTEGSVEGGFNNIVVTANTPEAMAQKMAEVADVSLTETQQAVQQILPPIAALQQQAPNLLNNLQSNLPVINQLNEQVNSFLGGANQLLTISGSAKGLLNSLVENVTGSIGNDIQRLLSINVNLPPQILNEAIRFVQASDYNSAARLLQSFSDLPLNDLVDSLEQIDTTLIRDVESQTANTNTTTPTISPTQRPQNPNLPVSQGAVLYGLISSIDRDITELLFRTISLPTSNTELDLTEYPNYHFAVQSDGTLNRISALNELLDVAGHQNYSLGIIVAARNGVVTPEQITTIDNIMRTFFSLIPYGQIVNYAEVVVNNRPDILFDFVEHASEHFNYTPILSNNISSLSTEQIHLLILGAVQEINTHVDDSAPEDLPGANTEIGPR